MPDRIKEILNRIKEFWNKFTAKQKAIIVSVTAAVLMAILILVIIVTRTQYTHLITCETTKEANSVVSLLEGAAIPYELSNNSMTVSVDTKQYDAARLLLGANDIETDGMSIEELFDNSMSTTENERQLKSTIYMQDNLANTIESFEGVKEAVVYISSETASNSIFDEQKERSASVVLTTNEDFKEGAAFSIAQMVATALGNENTDNIRVTDSKGDILFNGTSDLYTTGSLASNEEFKQQLRNNRANDIRYLVLKMGYDDAEIVPNLSFNMDVVEELYTEYTPTPGSDQGVYKHSYTYKSENSQGVSGVPGTDSNNSDTSYEIEDGTESDAIVEYEDIEYLPNERQTNTKKEIGAIDASKSSVSIVLTKYKIYNEEELEAEGELEDITFEQYIKENELETVTSLEVEEKIYNSVSAATGIDVDSITITAFEQPIFQFKEDTSREISDYFQVILLVLIIAMILFVVFKATAPVEVTELTPELSVEEMLASKVENEPLEDIEYKDKTGAKEMIENFVTENPEAVAQLLRNWLNDDWV